jgi:DNA ligase-1
VEDCREILERGYILTSDLAEVALTMAARTLALADACGGGGDEGGGDGGGVGGGGDGSAGGGGGGEAQAGLEGPVAAVKAARPLTRAAGKMPNDMEGGSGILVDAHRTVRQVEELATLTEGLKAKVEEGRELLERGYILTSDLGEVARTLAADGFGATGRLKMKAGVPVRSMLAERLGSVEEILEKMGGTAAFEYKYDGLRVQAHITPEGVRLFSRNLEEITGQFPDLVERFRGAAGAGEAIVDGECLPVDPDTGEVLPFQVVSRRRGRKYGLATGRSDGSLDGETGSTFEDEFPVVVVLFDMLLKDGEPLMDLPYPERRKRLEEGFGAVKDDGRGEGVGGKGGGEEGGGEDGGEGKGDGKDGSGPDTGVRLSTQMVTSDPAKASAFFDASLADGCEGVVAKSVADDSFYRAGARGWQWIKFKRDYRSEMTDTADLVVVGAFHGKGRRTGFYGALLMACHEAESGKYQTVCKLGTGFTDEALARMKELLTPHLTGGSGEVRPASVDSRMEPEVWLDPAVVLEVAGAELTLSPVHSCAMGKYREDSGLAIRFPRYTGRLRDDKSPENATTTAEMSGMYEAQLKKV